MLLTITNTRFPTTDLGWLLHKRPTKVQSFELSFGKAHVFYPEATDKRCTAALVLDVDPIGLVRGRRGPAGEGFSLEQYVNDRPYVASSFMSVALAQVFGTALGGRCKDRPELVEEVWPLEVGVSVLPSRGGENLLRKLFEPLGYEVTATRHTLDARFAEWGESHYFTVTLRGQKRVKDLLSHLYVLIPVLDNDKHYWVGDEELEKLLRHGEGWLPAHPERELITRRYLKHQRHLAREALARLAEEDHPDPDAEEVVHAQEEMQLEAQVGNVPSVVGAAEAVEISDDPEAPKLHTQRLRDVLAALRESGASSVIDLGCGEGKLLKMLLGERQFARIVGMDVALRSLNIAEERLRLEELPPTQRARVTLMHGSLMYRDQRLTGFDAAACVEVIEHLDPPRLAAFERVVFEFARPGCVVITTPNREYNVKWESLAAGKFRHRDHRFEWTRAEFEAWARAVAERFGYAVGFRTVGPVDEVVGAPTQMGLFQKSLVSVS